MMKVRVVNVVRRGLQTLATASYKLCILIIGRPPMWEFTVELSIYLSIYLSLLQLGSQWPLGGCTSNV